jgi:hypothetical protein
MAGRITRNDLQVIADDRLIEQYRDSVNLRAMVALYVTQLSEVQAAAWELLDQFDIDVASGWLLSALGRIIGIPRPTFDRSLIGYFGYLGATAPSGYGSVGMPEEGGIYLSAFEDVTGNSPMQDNDYRLHIYAKLIRVRSMASADDGLRIINLVIPNPGAATSITTTAAGEADVSIARALAASEKVLFNTPLNNNDDRLIPRPAGVTITHSDINGPF